MPKTISEHWILEFRKDDYGETASGIDKSSRFKDKETAKEAGEMIADLQNPTWVSSDHYDDGERINVHGSLIRVRKDTDQLHEEGEIPSWCESKKKSRERLRELNSESTPQ